MVDAALKNHDRSFKELLGRPPKNPVAAALMAKMAIDPQDRPKVKWWCYRLLATLKLDRARAQLIGGFVNAYLELSEREEQVFREELAKAAPEEKEAIMELTNPWKEEGRKEGRQEGLEQGLEQGRQAEAASLVLRLLTRRLGTVSPERAERIRSLPVDRLEALAEAIFEIEKPEDLDERF